MPRSGSAASAPNFDVLYVVHHETMVPGSEDGQPKPAGRNFSGTLTAESLHRRKPKDSEPKAKLSIIAKAVAEIVSLEIPEKSTVSVPKIPDPASQPATIEASAPVEETAEPLPEVLESQKEAAIEPVIAEVAVPKQKLVEQHLPTHVRLANPPYNLWYCLPRPSTAATPSTGTVAVTLGGADVKWKWVAMRTPVGVIMVTVPDVHPLAGVSGEVTGRLASPPCRRSLNSLIKDFRKAEEDSPGLD
jgi:hypothetical protein